MHKSYNLQKACTIDKSLLFDTLALIFRFWNEKIDVIHSFFRMGSILQIFLTMHKCIKIKTTSCINYVFPFLLCVVKKKSVTLKKNKKKTLFPKMGDVTFLHPIKLQRQYRFVFKNTYNDEFFIINCTMITNFDWLLIN